MNERILYLQNKKSKLLNLPNVANDKQEYLNKLNDEISKINKRILIYQEKKDELNLELKNAKKLNDRERKEIKSLEILSQLPNVYEDKDEECLICGKNVKREKNKCICGNDREVELFHFSYTKEDYIDILKSKVSVNKTTKQVIKDLEAEISDIKISIDENTKKIKNLLFSINEVNVELTTPDVEKSIKEINKEISILDDLCLRIKLIEDENRSLEKINEDIIKLEKKIDSKKSQLSNLEFEKDKMLEKNLNIFETYLNEYLERYYNQLGEKYKYKVKLNRDYLPIRGTHIPHSELTEIKIFYYLSILKFSVNNDDVTYPKLLIIDTIKDHGIDNKRLEQILKIICEFDSSNCQIIMTSGYEEFNNLHKEYSNLVIERIGKSKLLTRN